MKIKFIDVEGYRTRYIEEGSGPALLLIHGIGHSGDMFFRNVDVLAERYRVIAPDLPGHGFSDNIPLGREAPQPVFVRHLQALMDDLVDEPFSVAGSSYGGLIACLMALSRPERVRKLLIIGSGGTFQSAVEQKAALLKILDNASGAMGTPTLASCRARLANICANPSSVAEEVLLTQLTSYALDDRFDSFKAILSAYIDSLESDQDRVLARLEQIATPTLIIAGRQDIRATVESHQKGNERMPNASLVIFEDCGHLPYMEHAALFNEKTLQFLSR
jgi:2-hydroxy-6-oxonona-2,4-dienedioate hydrolase